MMWWKLPPDLLIALLLDRIAGCGPICRALNRIDRWWLNWPLEPFDRFDEWWRSSAVADRKRLYHGRHRYEDAWHNVRWRKRIASYRTSEWPTLATSGDASALVLVPQLTYGEWDRMMRFFAVT